VPPCSTEAWLMAVLADRRLGHNAQRVAEVLARSFSQDGAAQASYDRIADEAGIFEPSVVRRAVARLERCGFIEIERPSDANHRGRGLRYALAMPAAAVSASNSLQPLSHSAGAVTCGTSR
jgi:hypothetical protein